MHTHPDAATYLLTWRTYATWLPGDDRGWVDERRNGVGEPMHGPDHRLESAARGQMKSTPVILNDSLLRLIDDALREACAFRHWRVHALNVRTNHVHIIVTTNDDAAAVRSALKARSTRAARERGLLPGEAPLWARGGSARRLTTDRSVSAAVDYVRNRQ